MVQKELKNRNTTMTCRLNMLKQLKRKDSVERSLWEQLSKGNSEREWEELKEQFRQKLNDSGSSSEEGTQSSSEESLVGASQRTA